MWIVFLYTVVNSVLLGFAVTSVSKKGIDPSVTFLFIKWYVRVKRVDVL